MQNKEKRAREQMASERSSQSRQWYLDATQWVTDCGALGGSGAMTGGVTAVGADGTTISAALVEEDEEMVVPADENFPRCPVSNEVFQTFWDFEEGDYMYRNAVKVLLTEDADSELYRVSQNTSQPGARYALVHKRMALDGWVASGKAVSLKDAMVLRKTNPELVDYAKAGNVDDDEDDVFVVLPPSLSKAPRSSDSSDAVVAEAKED